MPVYLFVGLSTEISSYLALSLHLSLYLSDSICLSTRLSVCVSLPLPPPPHPPPIPPPTPRAYPFPAENRSMHASRMKVICLQHFFFLFPTFPSSVAAAMGLLMKQLLPLHRTPSDCPIDVLQAACLMALSAGSVKNSRSWACLEDVLSCALFQVTGTLEGLSRAQCGIVSPVFISLHPALIVTCVLSRAASVGHLLRT